MSKKDVLLAAIVLLVAGSALLVMGITRKTEGSCIRITVDGEEYGVWELTEDQEIEVETTYGCNVVCIRDGSVYMEEADCPDGYCVKQGNVSRAGETIVCLPHRLVVEVLAAEDGTEETGGVDSISR